MAQGNSRGAASGSIRQDLGERQTLLVDDLGGDGLDFLKGDLFPLGADFLGRDHAVVLEQAIADPRGVGSGAFHGHLGLADGKPLGAGQFVGARAVAADVV